MQKITPSLWFGNNAEDAAHFYVSIFENSKILNEVRYGDAGPGPEGAVMTLTFQLEGQEFFALNGGPVFTFTPAISFFVNVEKERELEQLWKKLGDRGIVFMPLDRYPFSEKFGWVQDRFGVSWQLNLASQKQKIAPFLMYVGTQHGKAEEAMRFYVSLFRNSRIDKIERYGPAGPGQEGAVKRATFTLNGQEFMAIDSNGAHQFSFSPAISLFVSCETQHEVDDLWERLSAGGEKGQCGWLKDKYGVSWQIVPAILNQLLQDKDPEKARRVMQAMLQMSKLDIEMFKQAYDQASG